MNNYNNLQNVVSKINEIQNTNLVLNEDAKKDENVSVILQIVTLIGGFFANSSFFGFLAVTGIFDNEITLGILGLLLVITTYVIHKKTDSVLIQTLLISTFLSGITSLIGSLVILESGFNTICIIVIILSLASFYFYNNFIIRLIAVIGFVFCLTIFLNYHGLVFLPIVIYTLILISLYVLLKNEAKWLNDKNTTSFYRPLVSGLQALIIYSFFRFDHIFDMFFNFDYIDSVYFKYFGILNYCLCGGLYYFVIIDILKNRVKSKKNNIIWILIPLTLIVAACYFASSIIFGLCCILIAFYFKERLFFGASIIALIYTLSSFYYYLNISLLYKSEILMASGLLFLILYFLILKLTKNEKAIDSNHSN